MLIVVFILIFIAIQRIYMCIITIFSLTFKLKYLNFINLFIFGFFKVHIVLFYITAIVGYFISLNYNYINLKLKLNRNILFISIAFLLGSLWSLYLFNWGYYWTNDSIEYVLLFFILYQIIIVHIWKKKVHLISIYLWLNICILFMIRLNIIYTRHNFFQQNTLVYFNIKLFCILIIQSFIYNKSFNKFYLCKINISGFFFLITILLIVINFINLFFFKLFMYNCYMIIFFLFILVNRWSTLKYLYIHIFSFLIYICFNVVVTHYFFYFRFDSNGNIFQFYNYFILKHVLNYMGCSMLFHFNNLSNNGLFSKIGGLSYLHPLSSIPQKTLINFII